MSADLTPAELAEGRARRLRRMAEAARKSWERHVAESLRHVDAGRAEACRGKGENKRKEMVALDAGAAALEELARALRAVRS